MREEILLWVLRIVTVPQEQLEEMKQAKEVQTTDSTLDNIRTKRELCVPNERKKSAHSD